MLPAIWIPDPATRAQRQLLRGRAFLVRQRTVLKNRIHAYLTGENLRSPAVDLYGRAGRAWLATLVLPPGVRRDVDLLLANLDLLSTQILALDKYLQRHVRQDAVASGCRPYGSICSYAAQQIGTPLGSAYTWIVARSTHRSANAARRRACLAAPTVDRLDSRLTGTGVLLLGAGEKR